MGPSQVRFPAKAAMTAVQGAASAGTTVVDSVTGNAPMHLWLAGISLIGLPKRMGHLVELEKAMIRPRFL
jgi:hypothetical protein